MKKKVIEPTKTMKGLTFVLGASRLGASIAAYLNEHNIDVVVVDKNALSFEKLPESFSGFKLLGDVLDNEFLKKNDIRSAKHVIIVTDDDNVNILAARICNQIFDIDDVYIRLLDIDKGRLLEGTKIKPFYPFNLSRDTLLHLMEGDQE